MPEKGVIFSALSGFYYINHQGSKIECRARGKFRKDGMTPLVGDVVDYSLSNERKGIIEKIYERKNGFIRPAVANVDTIVFVASGTKPVTDPFLVDRVAVIAESAGCDFVLCLNKTDLDSADSLYQIYSNTSYQTIRTSAETGDGIDALFNAIRGKRCVFTGNSGVGKSSILNRILPDASIETAEISDRLGRGKHTTRHVELYDVGKNTFIADTPGFASFEIQMIGDISKEDLPTLFPEFTTLTSNCRFNDCCHISEPGCAVREALSAGQIEKTRYDSYVRLYDIVSNRKPWD